MIPDKFDRLMRELERFGAENDAQATSRAHKMLNITRDAGEFLLLLIRATKVARVLEIGTSNGYSTLWLALGVQPLNGRVTTLDKSAYKNGLARANFARSELQPWIDNQLGDAGEFLKQQPQDTFDFVFLDSERSKYIAWWPDLRRVLIRGGLLVIDNALSHARELEPFTRLIEKTPGYMTSLVPMGKGELVVLKDSA